MAKSNQRRLPGQGTLRGILPNTKAKKRVRLLIPPAESRAIKIIQAHQKGKIKEANPMEALAAEMFLAKCRSGSATATEAAHFIRVTAPLARKMERERDAERKKAVWKRKTT